MSSWGLGRGVFRTLPYCPASGPSPRPTGCTERKVTTTGLIQAPYFCRRGKRPGEEVTCSVFSLLCRPVSWSSSPVLMLLWSLSRGTAKCMAKPTGDLGSCLSLFCINTAMFLFPLNPKDLECDKNGSTCWTAWLRGYISLGPTSSSMLPRMAFFPKGRKTESTWLKSFNQIIDEKYRSRNCSLSSLI